MSAWQFVLAAGGAMVVLYALLPETVYRDGVYDATAVLAVAAAVWGVRRHRPRPAWPWWMLIASLVLFCAGDLAYDVLVHGFGREGFPSLPDGLYLASYPVLGAGIAGLVRSRGDRLDRTVVLDALFASLAFAVVVTVYLIVPSARGADTFLAQFVSAAYPAMDVLLLTVLVRLLLADSRPSPSTRLLLAAVVVELAADLVYARLALHDGYTAGGLLDAAFLVSYLCRAAAALHPSMASPAPVASGPRPANRSSLWLVAAAAVVLPGLAATAVLTDDPGSALMLSLASGAGFLLLTARSAVVQKALRGAARHNRELLEREQALRSLSTTLARTLDRRGIYDTAVEHAAALAGAGADAVLFIGNGHQRALAATGRLRPLLGRELDITGISPAVLGGVAAGETRVLPPAAADALHAAFPEAFRGRPLIVVPVVTGGTLRGEVVSVVPGDNAPDGLCAAFCALGSNVSVALEAVERAEELLEQRSEERFGALMHNSSDVIGLVHPDGTIQLVTPSVTRVLGWQPDELLRRPLLDIVHLDDLPVVEKALAEAMLRPGIYGPIAGRARHRDGSWRDVEVVGSSLLDDPAVNGIVFNLRDITERVRLEGELAHQAFHDPLTGLANRALFRDRVAHMLRSATRTGRKVEILFLDLDDFKAINDGLGHRAGDAVLVAVAERLAGCIRPGDTAARLGGDEFAVLVDDGGASGELVAERIVAALQAPIVADGQEVRARASIGIAAGRSGATSSELLRDADLAMYAAKGQGKNRWVAFRSEMLDAFLGDLELERDLRLALDQGGIDVHYQPVVDLAGGGISGAEALVRWTHPERGAVPPAAFVPVAERSGLIVALGRHVLHRACRDAAAWVQARPAVPFSVSVNVSAGQLREPGLIDEVRAALAESGLPPSRLVVEVTESLLLENFEESVERLRFLRGLGVRVAIDDFGTGYSSLSYLGNLPVDILKIDKSFVDGVATGDEQNLVPTILALSRTLGLRTVAEGVETAEQAARLAELGCPLAQGFYFSRPVPAAEMARQLAAGRALSPADA